MSKTIWAIYENQALRPLEPLDLRDGQRVYIQVLEVKTEEEPRTVREEPEAYAAVAAKEPGSPEREQGSAVEAEGSIDALLQRLIRERRLRPRPAGPIPPPPLSEAELDALADRLGSRPGKSASEMVIEDRGECQ